MEIQVPYGRSYLTANIPDHIGVDIIEAVETLPAADPLGIVNSALENLLGNVSWADFANVDSVAIAISDKTRPVPHHQLLPPLMEHLSSLGIPDSAIIFYVAVGTHPPMTPEEFPDILPRSILKKYKVVSHDAENDDLMIELGTTRQGTPIWSNKDYFKSEFKIVVGNIEPHQFAGFSGGVKAAAIGLSALETINTNHSLLTNPDSQLGVYDSNPARQDIEEIGQKINVHLALNAVLNRDKKIVHVLAGDPKLVVQAGLELSRQVCQVPIQYKYNLVISSPGGHPKDINVYQSQKGLAHAALLTKQGGTVILTAACPEGTGSPHYEEWMNGKSSYEDVLENFKIEGFHIGPHKAFQIARDASQLRLFLISELDKKFARYLLLNPVQDLQTAIDLALVDLQPGERIGILPHASTTIPYIPS